VGFHTLAKITKMIWCGISYVGQDYKDDLVWEHEDCDALQAASEEFMVQHFNDQNSLAIHAQRSYVSPNDAAFLRTCRQLTGSLKFSRPNHEQKCTSVPESKYRLWRKCNKAQNTSANRKKRFKLIHCVFMY
jgi:hypothetical protein